MHAPAATTKLTLEQYQQVLDAYSVGRITAVVPLPGIQIAVPNAPAIKVSRVLLETSRKLCLLVYAINEAIHDLWWSSPTEEAFPLSLMESLKLTHVQPLATQQDVFTVHRFDHRFTLFVL